MSGGSLHVMSSSEITVGYLFGQLDAPVQVPRGDRSPRVVLEELVRAALSRPPCGVAFSGGRDSALVLAVATHVARRDGLPEPVPITRRFDAPEADERSWQEEIVRHVGLADWHRIELGDDLDLVGPIATRHLRSDGVVWPPAIGGDAPLVDAVRGGSLIDGEGGDQVLDVAGHRIAPLAALVRSPRPLRHGRARAALAALQPAGPRSRRVARQIVSWYPRPWLRPAGLELLRDALEAAERSRPLPFATSVRSIAGRKAEVIASRNRTLLAERAGVVASCPLLDPALLDAVARDGRLLGRPDRAAMLRSMAADLLPDHVLARTTKATFTTCYLASHTRAFAERWTGSGVDAELVDAERLREAWLAEQPLPQTAALLQAAWKATDELSRA